MCQEKSIYYLREQLLKVVIDHGVLHGQACQGRVISHRAQTLLPVLDHGQQQQGQHLNIVAE